MQSSLTVKNKLWTVEKIAEVSGFQVPWEAQGYGQDFETGRARGGFFDLSHWGTVGLQGPDTADYLNRMTTLNFKSYPAGHAARGAFLTGRAGVVALGIFLPAGEGYHFIVSPGQSTVAAEHAEKFHFLEDLTVADISADWALFGLWNLPALGHLPLPDEPMLVEVARGEFGSLQMWRDNLRHSLSWARILRPEAGAFLKWLRSHDVALLGERLFEYHRIMCAMPRVGAEVSDRDLILEANLELAISRNKGCYPGQEVVERIFTYGQVNRKLLPVRIEGSGELPALPFDIHLGESRVGTVVSAVPCPQQTGVAIGLAYIHRFFWQSADTFTIEHASPRVTLRAADAEVSR